MPGATDDNRCGCCQLLSLQSLRVTACQIMVDNCSDCSNCTDDGRVRSCRQQSITVVVAAVRETVVERNAINHTRADGTRLQLARSQPGRQRSFAVGPITIGSVAVGLIMILRIATDLRWPDRSRVNDNWQQSGRSRSAGSRSDRGQPIAIRSRSDRDRIAIGPIAIRPIAIDRTRLDDTRIFA